MKLIIGLGNPGEYYKNTGHNAGFMIIDELSKIFGIPIMEKYDKKKISNFICSDLSNDFVLIKPQDYINNSGKSILKFLDFFNNFSSNNFLIIYDDINLPLGKIRFRKYGSDGGHNGMKNIIDNLKTYEIERLRIGIGRNPYKSIKEHVMNKMNKEEIKNLFINKQKIINGIKKWIEDKEIDEITRTFNQ